MPNFSSIQLAYLSKGMVTLRKFFDEDNKALEAALKKQITETCLDKFAKRSDRFTPYAIAKLTRYLALDQLDR